MDTVQAENSHMLNLVVGKRYKVTTFAGDTPIIGTIKFKEVKDETIHAYWIAWWNEERKQNIGHYIFDQGYANRGRTIVNNIYSIRTCKEACSNTDKTKD